MKVLVLEVISYYLNSYTIDQEIKILLFKDAESFLKYNGEDLPDSVKRNRYKLLRGLKNLGLGEIEDDDGDQIYLYYQEVI